MKTSTLAAAIGIITGLWTAWFNWVEYAGTSACTFKICPELPNTLSNPIFFGAVSLAGVLLILSSAISFIGPKAVLYISLALSVLIALTSVLTFVLVGNSSLPYFLPTLALSTTSALFNAIAARSKTSLPPGSHPMDLPVFG
jgi:hypothetical protein